METKRRRLDFDSDPICSKDVSTLERPHQTNLAHSSERTAGEGAENETSRNHTQKMENMNLRHHLILHSSESDSSGEDDETPVTHAQMMEFTKEFLLKVEKERNIRHKLREAQDDLLNSTVSLVETIRRLDTVEGEEGVLLGLGLMKNVVRAHWLKTDRASEKILISCLLECLQHDSYEVKLTSSNLLGELIGKDTPMSSRDMETILYQLRVCVIDFDRDPTWTLDLEQGLLRCVRCCLEASSNHQRFLEGGLQSMVTVLEYTKNSQYDALKVLEKAFDGPQELQFCKEFVNSRGLDVILSLLVPSVSLSRDTTLVGVICSLMKNVKNVTHMYGASKKRRLIIEKFSERNYEKVHVLMEIYSGHSPDDEHHVCPTCGNVIYILLEVSKLNKEVKTHFKSLLEGKAQRSINSVMTEYSTLVGTKQKRRIIKLMDEFFDTSTLQSQK